VVTAVLNVSAGSGITTLIKIMRYEIFKIPPMSQIRVDHTEAN